MALSLYPQRSKVVVNIRQLVWELNQTQPVIDTLSITLHITYAKVSFPWYYPIAEYFDNWIFSNVIHEISATRKSNAKRQQ